MSSLDTAAPAAYSTVYGLFFSDAPNNNDWCAPALGVFTGCNPDDRSGFSIHNWVMMAINLLAATILLASYIRHGVLLGRIPRDVRFVFSVLCVLDNIFIALWCILREVPQAHPVVRALMFHLAGSVCIIPAFNYVLLSYREMQQTDNLLVYAGVRTHLPQWIIQTVCGIVFFAFYLVAATGPKAYGWAGRVFFNLFVVLALWVCGGGLRWVHTFIRKFGSANTLLAQRIKYLLILMIVAGMPTLFLAGVSPMLFDRVTWLWHIFYCILESPMAAMSIILAAHSWSVTTVTLESSRSQSATSAKMNGSNDRDREPITEETTTVTTGPDPESDEDEEEEEEEAEERVSNSV